MKRLLMVTAILLLALAPPSFGQSHFIGTDNEPPVNSGEVTSSSNVTYIYGTDVATADGEITQIRIYIDRGTGTIDFAIFSKSGSSFTDLDSVSLSYVLGLNTWNAPGDFTAMPISTGEYIGFHLTSGDRIDRATSGGGGSWLDSGNQIGDGIGTTFSELSTTDDIQIQAFNTVSGGPEPTGQIIQVIGQ